MYLPIQVVFLTDVHAEPGLNEAVKYNLSSAACCAVLMMEDDVPFTCSELFSTVAGLSYKGIRTRYGTHVQAGLFF